MMIFDFFELFFLSVFWRGSIPMSFCCMYFVGVSPS